MSTLNEQMQGLSLPPTESELSFDQLKAMLHQSQALIQQQRQQLQQQQRRLNPFQYDVKAEELTAAQQIEGDVQAIQDIVARLLPLTEDDMGMVVDPNFVLPLKPTAEGVLGMVKVSTNIYLNEWHKPLLQFARRTLPDLAKAAKTLARRRHQTASTDNKVRVMARDRAKDMKAQGDLKRQRLISHNRAMGRGAAEEDDTSLPPSSIPARARTVPLSRALRGMTEDEAVEDNEAVENDIGVDYDDLVNDPSLC